MTTPRSGASPNAAVKIVDFGPFLDGTDKQGVADAILDSFKNIGFVYLVNHGLPQTKIDSMFEWSRKLFSQTPAVKQLAPHPSSGAHHRGYSAPGKEKVQHFKYDMTDPSAVRPSEIPRDIKESFEVGREDNEAMPNIWYPEGTLPGLKEACLDFYWTCYETEKMILRALALGFHVPEEYFLPHHANADNQLRLLHYPSIPASTLGHEDASRIPSHADFCSLTLLMQDDVGGLEVQDANHPGGFVAVPPVAGSIVVNAGDCLMMWSNDTIRSTVHRVRSPTLVNQTNGVIPARYSIPYFCGADFSTVVDSIPGTWSADRPKLYEPTSAGEYIMKRLALNY
ncbi:Clavaminate synthase-like protein [Crassisporium funariophilum]|nr:Clavaminate synthase-like protein [Crassisporium funariophilum]